MRRRWILLLLTVALAAVPAGVSAQNRWAKGIGSSYLASGLHSQGTIARDASVNWLKYSTENDDVPSASFGNYEMTLMNAFGVTVVGAKEYLYPNQFPADPTLAGKTGPWVTGLRGGLFDDGWWQISRTAAGASRGAPVRLSRLDHAAVTVNGGNNTVRRFSHRPSTEDQNLFSADGDRVVSTLWSDQAIYTKSQYFGGGTEVTAWLYGSGTQGYTDHNIVTLTFSNTGRVPLNRDQAGYYQPGKGAADGPHGATVIPAEIAAARPDLKGFVVSLQGSLSPFDLAEKQSAGNSGLTLGTRGDRLYIYDDVNKLIFSVDGEDLDAATKPNRGDPTWPLGPSWTQWNTPVDKKVTPGEFLDVAVGGVLMLHVDRTPVDQSASPTLENPTLGGASLSANWLTDPASTGTDTEQPMAVRLGDIPPTINDSPRSTVYDHIAGVGLGARSSRLITAGTDWLQRPANKGAWDFAARKWKAGLDPATLDYTKKNIGAGDPSLNATVTYGPWDLPYGKHLHVAYALVAGGTDRALNQVVGQFYLKKKWLTRAELDQFQDLYDDWDYLQTYAYWKNTFTQKAGQAFTESDKHAFMNSVFDSLYAEVARVKQVWADGVAAGRFGPSYPAFVGWPTQASYVSAPGKATLSWNALTGASRYRVYRTLGDYGKQKRLVGEVSGTSFEDLRSQRGVSYYYSVAAVDAQGREGTPLMTMATLPVIPLRGPAGTDWRDRVVVVPNPYQKLGGQEKDGGFNFSGAVQAQHSVSFINLPPKATINVFTTSGDLVTTLFHRSGTGDETWYLLTDNNQRPVSGLYLCHIRNDDAPGEVKMLKLVVVR